jgi:hypothetical protein
MLPPRLVLAADDATGCSRAALDFAARLAQQRHAELRVLHVATGPAAATICVAAAEHGADLIVMGPHGQSGAARAVLGSTTEAVLQQAATDVVVVPPSWSPPAAEAPGLSSIGPVVVGVRDVATAEPGITTAHALAATLGTHVEVVYALRDGSAGNGIGDQMTTTQRILVGLCPAGDRQAATAQVLHGEVEQAMLGWLATPARRRSVLVLDRTHDRGRREIGASTRALLTHATVPMLWRP